VPVREEKDPRIERYAEAAAAHGRATEGGDSKSANKAYDIIADVYRELREEGARDRLLPLLEHPDASVRCWAGAHALEFAPEDGERVLTDLAQGDRSTIGFDAKMTLSEWRAGKLTFP
jgi:hypothetical protein